MPTENISLSLAESLGASNQVVGGVIYGGGRKLVALGEDFDGKLCVKRLDDFQSPINSNQIREGDKRVLDLRTFNDIQVLQAGLEAVSVRLFRSIRGFPSVGISIKAEDPETKTGSPLVIEEDKILRLFAGEDGGIALFSGFDLPESNALLFTNRSAAQNRVQLLFIKPIGLDQVVADSVDGVYQLLKQLNVGFIEKDPLSLQKQAMACLTRAIKAGKLDFCGSEVRQEIYRAHIIALARLAEKTDGGKYREQLEEELPDLNKSWRERADDFIRRKPSVSSVDAIINGLIKTGSVGVQGTEKTAEEIVLTPKDQGVCDGLTLSESKALWIELAKDRSYRSDNNVSRNYITELIKRIYQAKQEAEFTDLEKLIKALFDTEYAERTVYCDFEMGDEEGFISWASSESFLYQYTNTISIRNRLSSQLNKFKDASLGKK